MRENKGVFVLSLDTELAWGMFDIDRVEEFASAYRNTQHVVDQLCELFDEYQIPATWAIVSHLVVDCTGGAEHLRRTEPDFDWIDDWFTQLPCRNGLDRELWYAPWLLDRLRSCETNQEIGLHGSTHMPFGARGCSKQNAEEEIKIAVNTLQNVGVEPTSFVFPRNSIGYVEILAEYGIETYRGIDARWYENSAFPNKAKQILRFGDEIFRTTPPVVKPTIHKNIVNIPGSQIFRPTHGAWKLTPSRSSIYRANKGLEIAAKTGNIFHLWLHPFNLGHNPQNDLKRFEEILSKAKKLADKNLIECQTMNQIGLDTRRGRWSN